MSTDSNNGFKINSLKIVGESSSDPAIPSLAIPSLAIPSLASSPTRPDAQVDNKPARRPHSLLFLASRVFNTPLLLEPEKARIIADILGPRALRAQSDELHYVLQPPPTDWDEQYSPKPDGIRNAPDGVSIIDVSGSLVHRTRGLSALSGLTSYEQIALELDEANANPAVNTILLRLDSSGGEVHGAFDLADRIASSSKPVYAAVDDQAFSAAYLLACCCSRVYVTRTSGVGSIGVVLIRADLTEADRKEGIRYHVIQAGARKTDYNPHTEFTWEARESAEKEVQRIYRMFVQYVAARRGISEERIRALEAGLVWGEEAVRLGLADAMGTFEEVLELVTQLPQLGTRLGTRLGSDNGSGLDQLPDPGKHTTVPIAEDFSEPVGNDPAGTGSSDAQDRTQNAHLGQVTGGMVEEQSKMSDQSDKKAVTTSAQSDAVPQPAAVPAQVSTDAVNIVVAADSQGAPVEERIPNSGSVFAPSPVASMEFIVEMLAIADIPGMDAKTALSTARQLKDQNLTEAEVRRKLVQWKAESRTGLASPVLSAVNPAQTTLQVDLLAAKARELSMQSGGNYYATYRSLLRSNPQAYVEYLRSRPDQTGGRQV